MSSLVLLLINSSTQINLPCQPTNLNFIARFREKNHVAPGISGTSTLKSKKGYNYKIDKAIQKNLMNLIV